MRVLITGGGGYVGSVLTRRLINEGYKVTILDNLMYGADTTINLDANIIIGDVRDRDIIKLAIKNIDAVIHLACIVGDAACKQRPNESYEINYLSTKFIAQLLSKKKIRFIYPSTCSVYGVSGDEIVNEECSLNPVSLYARTKIDSEEILNYSGKFIPCVLRLSTVYGLSPRMRFDLLINEFTAQSYFNERIEIYSGDRWRPFIHIDDVAKAFQSCLEAPERDIKRKIFNVGGDNMKISSIGEIYQSFGIKVKSIDKIKDIRTYRVSFKKIRDELKFYSKKTVENGIKEIYQSLEDGKYDDYLDDEYYNHKR